MADELISRQAALDVVKFKTIDDGGVVDDCIMQVLALAKSKINKLPAVDALEVVHGYNTGRARWFECSVCGYGFNDIFLLDESDDMMEPKYCAHCGAKMDGERREENAAD